jgi:hypothetical protein
VQCAIGYTTHQPGTTATIYYLDAVFSELFTQSSGVIHKGMIASILRAAKGGDRSYFHG